MDSASIGVQPLSRTRKTWFSALSVVFALGMGLGLFGWLFLLFGWFDNDMGGIHRVHDVAGTGVTIGISMATPLLVLAFRRDDVALLQEVAVAGLAFAVAAVLATDWGALVFLPIIAAPVIVLVAVGGGWRQIVAPGGGAAPALLVATVVAAPFWIAYALTMARLQRTGFPNDPHIEMHHWTSMASMALAFVLLGLLVSLRSPGWRIVAWTVGAGAAVFGLASIVFSNFVGSGLPYAGSEGVAWGLASIAWGVLILGAAELEVRRGRARA